MEQACKFRILMPIFAANKSNNIKHLTMTKKIVSLALFEETAKKNGYETFTAEEVAAHYKEGLLKSRNNELTPEQKDEFVADTISLQKAICQNEKGESVVMYYRKRQLDITEDADGNITKAVYADTPMNRRLNRVGKEYVPSADFLKSITGSNES